MCASRAKENREEHRKRLRTQQTFAKTLVIVKGRPLTKYWRCIIGAFLALNTSAKDVLSRKEAAHRVQAARTLLREATFTRNGFKG